MQAFPWPRAAYQTLTLLAAASVLAACGGGGGGPDAEQAADPAHQAAALESAKKVFKPTTAIPADAHLKGMFAPPVNWPLIPIHVSVLPDGRLLSFGTTGTGKQTGNFIYDVWDPEGGLEGGHSTLANTTGTDIFCSSVVSLASGNGIFIAGGDNWTGTGTTNTGNNNSNLFDISKNTLTRGINMNRARWYSSSTTLLNGEVYIQGGAGGQDLPEVRSTAGSFRLLSGASTQGLAWDFPRNFIAPDGRVFGYDGAGRMYYVNPTGTGSLALAGQFAASYAGGDASAAMFRPGRILQFGGNSNGAIVIDIRGGNPVVTPTQSMGKQRRLANATVLPNGQVLATGGSRSWNAMDDVSYTADLWNPDTGTWTTGATYQKARLYHSTAVLLPDATVLVGGGGAPGPQNNLNAELFFPPYLFASNGTLAGRPLITSAPSVMDVGRVYSVGTAGTGTPSRVVMVRTSSVTHSFNMDQRFVELTFSANGGTLAVQAPAKAADVPPGMYMLFVLNSAGVPSVAKMVRVNVAGELNPATVPTLAQPGDRASTTLNTVSLQLQATDPNGDTLRYAATGLPPGLSLNTATGLITGRPTTAGQFNVTASASDGVNSDSKAFVWSVANLSGPLQLTLATPTASASGANASFSASSPNGVNTRWKWNFGDGSGTAWASTPNVTHAYAAPGLYAVTVTALDDRNQEQNQTLLHTVYLPATAGKPVASSNLLWEQPTTGNARLWVVNPDADTVSVFDAKTRAKLKEVAVGRAPRAIARASTGELWVSHHGAASLSVIHPGTLAVSRTLALPFGSQPYGVAASGTGQVFVVLEGGGRLLRFDAASYAQTGSLAIGPNARHVSLSADGATAWVSRFITPPVAAEHTTAPGAGGAQVLQVATASMALTRTVPLAQSTLPDAENQGRGLPNYLGAAAISPDGTQAFVPSKLDNIGRGSARDGLPLNFQNTVRAVSSRLNLANAKEDLATRIDHDNASLASAAVFDPRGVWLFVALETSREVAVIDAHARRQVLRLDVGLAPQGLAVSADGSTLYVHNFMDRSIDAFDLRALRDRGALDVPLLGSMATVASEKLSPQVLKGKQFFYDARDTRLARDRYMSCASCHSDGGHDGRVWDLSHAGEGLRNTISLRGRGGAQGRLHWSANFDEVQDFEGQIRTLAGGSGLMRDADFNAGTRREPLGERKAGLSADLDALAAYVASLKETDASPARQADGNLTPQAVAGRTVFAAQCASCHGGTDFTDSASQVLHDTGTRKAASGQRLGRALNGIDTPTLRDVWATAPYLHDGSAATLEDAVRAHRGITLSTTDLAAVVAYTQQIGSGEASAPGSSANLVVRALSTLADFVGALFQVRVEGQVVAQGQLDSTAFVDLRFNTGSFAAGSRIDVAFTNDAFLGGQDRNFAVESLTLNGSTTLAANAPGVFIDSGSGASAFDGVDSFEAASTGGWLPWDAAIRFTAPASLGGGSDTVTVRAATTLAGGVGATIELRINGALWGTRTLTNTALADLNFSAPALQPGDRVDVVFINDATVNGQDRNLVVASISGRNFTVSAMDGGTTLDVGSGAAASDGLEVMPASTYGGWVPWNAAMRFTVPGAADTVTVRAAATLAANTGAAMQVYHQGRLIGSTTVANTTVKDFKFSTPSAVKAGDRIDVVFTNDATVNGEDRNLVVAAVVARGIALLPSDSTAVLDAGSGDAAFDGADTMPGGSFGGWIPWNAALRLTVR